MCLCVRVVCMFGNGIGAAGVTALTEALKENSSVQEIDLGGEWVCEMMMQCHGRLPSMSNVYVSGNRIGAAGVTALAEALKVNTKVHTIDLSCECSSDVVV